MCRVELTTTPANKLAFCDAGTPPEAIQLH